MNTFRSRLICFIRCFFKLSSLPFFGNSPNWITFERFKFIIVRLIFKILSNRRIKCKVIPNNSLREIITSLMYTAIWSNCIEVGFSLMRKGVDVPDVWKRLNEVQRARKIYHGRACESLICRAIGPKGKHFYWRGNLHSSEVNTLLLYLNVCLYTRFPSATNYYNPFKVGLFVSYWSYCVGTNYIMGRGCV
jgi:hypothetical protein